jgi:hypothetical protein
LTLDVVDRNDTIVANYGQRLSLGTRPELRLSVPLSSLSPGPFRLRVTADDGANDAVRELGIVVK